ncbi:PliI family lysozyme inhibitor of I-type lysozyme [Herminiimonas fonticola]|uniref:PliI/PliC-like inhibitor of I-type lysozyme n=1 Tax=Herminiimonas fonticola TaxID=303380 RepID=A0A4R6GI26_9BURK|nr:PliI family lysozyme inhibitor of I-type lysozyme [Herminiimonas fonticola]RBA25538.1 hypothetical protein Hfont_1171 [Herminiimonas fonticola]TDN94651.1 PliI/PliC-like inhibitor of I-type lysozyme [Herminiimonas fonticola]
MNKLVLFFLSAVLSTATLAAGHERIVKTEVLPQTKGMLVAAEGDLEPRSIGSYSLRLYAKNDPAYPYDNFISGVVRLRNGTLEGIKFADLDHDGKPEIIVTIRYVGSGSFVTVDAFRFRNKSLQLLTSIAGMDAKKDAIKALKNKLNSRH